MKLFKKPKVDIWDWHRWFAWYPVVVWNEKKERDYYVWLETVERMGCPDIKHHWWYRFPEVEEEVI